MSFTDTQQQQFKEQGFLRLGKVVPADQLQALPQRIDDIMLGRLEYENMRFQVHDFSCAGPGVIHSVLLQNSSINTPT